MMETEKYSEKLFRERSDEAWKTAPDTIDDEKMERMQRDIMSRISTVDDIFAKKEKKRFGVIRTVAAAAAIAMPDSVFTTRRFPAVSTETTASLSVLRYFSSAPFFCP